MSHFMTLKHRTYASLTLEFLSLFDYLCARCVHQVNGGAIFILFNKEYNLNLDEICAFFQFDVDHNECATEIRSTGP